MKLVNTVNVFVKIIYNEQKKDLKTVALINVNIVIVFGSKFCKQTRMCLHFYRSLFYNHYGFAHSLFLQILLHSYI